MRSFGVHICALDPECRYYGAPPGRIFVRTPWFFVSVAITHEDKFVGPWGVGTHWITVRWRS